MSIEMYAGMIVGILLVGLIAFVGLKAAAKRSPAAEDERMVMVKEQAGSLALRISGAIAFIGWVADNLLSYIRGEAIETINPWSIMLLVMVVAYTLSTGWCLSKHSAAGEEITATELAPILMILAVTIPYFVVTMTQGAMAATRALTT